MSGGRAQESQETMSDLRGYMSPKDAMKVIFATKSLRDKTILWLLFASGARLGELLLLRVEDIDFENKILYMVTLKRKRKNAPKRMVHVDNSTIKIILEYMSTYDIKNDVLIRLSARRIREIVLEAGIRAGVPRVGSKGIHPHHFRHSHCVAWVRRDGSLENLKKLQKRLGHASFNTTAYYLQFSYEDQKLEVESMLSEMLAPDPQEL